jgi:hypothetical protein
MMKNNMESGWQQLTNTRKRVQDANKAKHYSLWAISALYYAVGSIADCITVAGTIMQLLGVYRNCLCKAGLIYIFPSWRSTWSTAEQVKVSADSQIDRDQAQNWMVLGASGEHGLLFCALLLRGIG